MKTISKTKAFSELHELIVFYSENRDQPVEKGVNLFKNIKELCKVLDLDYEELKREFNLNEGGF